MAERLFSRQLQLMAKRANQRLVEMERRGLTTPAYEAGTAYLQSIGRHRFSETGKGTAREIDRQKRALERFLGYETSTVTGYKRYRKNVEEGLKKRYPEIDKTPGFTIDKVLELFKNLPADKKDRLYSSDAYVSIYEAYTRKQGKEKRDKEMSVEDLIKQIDTAGSFKDALKAVGLTFADVAQKPLGK